MTEHTPPEEEFKSPKHRERNPVLTLFLILIGLFVVGLLLIIFHPSILNTIFGNS